MRDLLDDGLSVLSDLLQSGGGSCHPETECQLTRLAERWESVGLHTGAQLLSQVAEALGAQRHGGEADSMLLMERVSRAARYTRFCEQKYTLDSAGWQLKQGQSEEESVHKEEENHEATS